MNSSSIVRVTCGDLTKECPKAEAVEVAGRLLAQTGLTHAALKFEDVVAKPAYSEFGEGRQVHDAAAQARIEAQHASLAVHGVSVDADKQLFATGTRMAESGYATQARRAQEHEAKASIEDVCHALAERVRSEQREDVEVSARDFADAVEVNGSAKVFGLKITEQAIRGLCARLESPATRYLLGLRDRIVRHSNERAAISEGINEGMTVEQIQNARARFQWLRGNIASDKACLADAIRRECRANPDVELKLRSRKAVGDVFAIVSPSYTPADAPEVIGQVADHIPAGSKGTWSYDPESTAWELRADVWTPTPAAQQAVGEAFEGYASFFGRDNGTGRFGGGGGVTLLRCLNASTYVADGSRISRIHRANVMVDMPALVDAACGAVDALCEAWGVGRSKEIPLPESLTIEQAIPGFWRHLLRDRSSELVAVLPGRSEMHVEGLSRAYHAERRDSDALVRADLAQGWTKYVQEQSTPVRRMAEQAIGSWTVSGRRVGHMPLAAESGSDE